MLELEHEQLSEQFRLLLGQQQEAEAGYARILPGVKDPGAQAQLRQIRRDKQRHIQLIQRLLEIVD